MILGSVGLGALISVMCVILILIGRHERAAICKQRAAIFDACLPGLDDYRITQDGVDFPLIEGNFRGHHLLLEPVVDAATFRKLPVLWLRVTLLEPLRIGAALSFLVRPQGTEFWSPSAELRHRLPIPADWPNHALLRSDRVDIADTVFTLGPQVKDFFSDPRGKEIAISPRGVRLVYQLDQARRSNYLVLRTALFDQASVTPALLTALAEHAVAIHLALGGARMPVRETADAC